nr:FAD-dependent monooxygenase [Pararhodobacter zhoushanensis]
MNLGWKLAAVIREKAPASLLDTYENERRPIGERLFVNTLAQVALVSRLDTREYSCCAGMDAALIRPVGYIASVGRRAQP